ncbi:unnamed protein product, partial [Iphiclides podalirius]
MANGAIIKRGKGLYLNRISGSRGAGPQGAASGHFAYEYVPPAKWVFLGMRPVTIRVPSTVPGEANKRVLNTEAGESAQKRVSQTPVSESDQSRTAQTDCVTIIRVSGEGPRVSPTRGGSRQVAPGRVSGRAGLGGRMARRLAPDCRPVDAEGGM